METLTKNTVTVEFEGKKYALEHDITIEELLMDLGLPKDKTVRLKITKDGFVLI